MTKFVRSIVFIVSLGCFLATGTLGTTVLGQTIHVILAADGTDTNIGNAVRADQANMSHLFQSNVPAANLNLIALDPSTLTLEGMLQAVERLNVAPNDTVVFYYSGHGAFDANGGKQFFELSNNRGKLYRETLLAKMEEKKPRLAVLLSDCCNNVINTVPGVREVGVTPQIRAPGNFSPLFENLFVFCSGVVDVTSSRPGEFSFTINSKDGSIFTKALIDVANQSKANDSMYWQVFHDSLSRETNKIFREGHPSGVRIPGTFKAELEKANGGHPVPDVQMSQTVHKYQLPGEGEVTTPVVQEGPRLGLRAANHADGVQITAIHPNSPASRTNIVVGEIITAINGGAVHNETNYSEAVDHSPKTMILTLKREDGTTRTVTVEMDR